MDVIRDERLAANGASAPLRLTPDDRLLARLDDLAQLLSTRLAPAAPAPPGAPPSDLESRLSGQIAMQGQIIDALMAERDRADRDLAALAARVSALEDQTGEGAAALRACADRLSELLLRLEAGTIDRLGAAPPLRPALAALADLIARLEARLAAETAPPPSRMIETAPAPAADDFRRALAGVLAPPEGEDAA
jgi:BMFP domain-containing protein YqiC